MGFRALGVTILLLTITGAMTRVEAQRAQGSGPVVLITGSTDGLGREVARRLAADGAHVIVHGRNAERGEALVAEIERAGRGSARFYAADFASLDQVRSFADAIDRDYRRIDVLVNNAGIWRPQGERQVSEDGHELHLAVNYLSHFLLTRRLLPLLERGAPARIVNVASVAQRALDFDDPMLERGYSGSRAYAQSKLAQVLHALDLAEELRDRGVIAVSLHPATLMNTSMVEGAGVAPRTSVEEGVEAVLHLLRSPDVRSGQYYSGLEPARADPQTYDAAARERLRRLSEELTR
jgi:NAD(P)-dependent dehydrogenase (short-subunit alcohol dehydrogenase family)